MILRIRKMTDMEPENVVKHYKYSDRFEKVGDSNIWVEINNLSREHNAVDLAEVIKFYHDILLNFQIDFFNIIHLIRGLLIILLMSRS